MRKITLKHTPPAGLAKQLTEDLNPSQREAATAPDGFNLILAGPGSGKTRVITYRVAWLIGRGVPAESILLATFTRRASREMVGRLGGLVGNDAGRVWAGTFHHVGNRLLRRSARELGFEPNFTILDGEDQTDLIRLAMDDGGLASKDKMAPKPSQVQHLISYAVNTRKPLDEVVAETAGDLIEWTERIQAVAQAYAARKVVSNCMDYDDLLVLWLKLLDEHPARLAEQGKMFRHILVDEMQDTNALQIEVVEKIARAGAGNLTAVGDDAQSIYRFRGADYDNILKFPERHPGAKIFRLDVNYRSTPQIVALTQASIARNQTGFPKELVSARPDGLKPVVVAVADVYEEAALVCQQILETRDQGIPLAEMAVLYRNHYDSVVLQGELLARNIPYNVRSGIRFFEQAHVKDVLAFLRVVLNPRDEASWRRLLLLLPGIGPAKAGAVYQKLAGSGDPFSAVAAAGTMATVPPKSRGLFAAFVNDLNLIRATDPENRPAAAIQAVLAGGYPATIRQRYDKPENRLKDVEQFAVLAAKYESLERLVADLMLAGDLYGVEASGGEDPQDLLVLSSVHQAKGLEWSHVFVIRLVDDGFPNRRAVDEPGGEEEERRIYYVAVSRAKNELMLSYPSTISRGGYGPTTFSTPSRFITEVDPELYERAELEHEFEILELDGKAGDGAEDARD
ncbi:ATP-dependent helicase [Paludisphaera soli]|uniref:ATP-dependent helicase n=1 Tax=Paludisphaera soli TaxID=2712865 RepID=UPI0013EDCCEE|nr:ATP-dependent helicase [Paludisphaera soli]